MLGGSNNDGAVVQTWECNGYSQQNWNIGSDGTIKTVGGKCLDADRYDSDGYHANVSVWGCSGGSNQKWSINSSTGSICNQYFPGKCLDVLNASNSNGARLQLYDFLSSGNDNQRWRVQ